MLDWISNYWLEVIGWTGSLLVVASLIVPSVKKFRWMNLSGALLATGYNIVFAIWPYAAMNGIISVIDIYWLKRLYRESSQVAVGTAAEDGAKTYTLLDCSAEPGILTFFLARHRGDIVKYFPNFDYAQPISGKSPIHALLLLREDEIIGTLIIREKDARTGEISLDYVTDKYRDFSPANFLYRQSGVFQKLGYERLEIEAGNATDLRHFEKIGFVRNGQEKDALVLNI